MKEKNNLLLPLSILSAAILISVIIFSLVWKSAKSAQQTITVTGSAKQEVTSDLAIQRGTIQGTNKDRKLAYQQLQQAVPVLLKFLEAKGFKNDQIELLTINGYPVYETAPNGTMTQNISHYVYSQRFQITSKDVDKIKDLSLTLSSLVEKGIDVNVEMPEYLYSKIDELKVAIQAAAAKNAKERAEKIAEATGRSLGPLRSARMGVIQITPKNSNLVSDYGINDNTSIVKDITAVVSAAFEIN
ncbi:SIMPL domain-containing protein [Melioribacteraceae bacterium 4301-Me]|uniref:SIMPL domain-containing protein n=1 Tax=Pyranulibacter aquaticus TaxID=3163344 RepID=UPI003597CB9F